MEKIDQKKKNESKVSTEKPSKVGKATISSTEVQELPGFPDEEGLASGPVAIIECPEEIACNVCESACPFGAITIGKQIKNIPELQAEKCIGCAKCVSQCPGLAIYTVDMRYSEDRALLTIPYEFDPLPKRGDTVIGVTREGENAGKVKVVSVTRDENSTSIVRIAVPKDKIQQIRGIRLQQ